MSDPVTARTANADLLVELGCEELPPKSLDALREAFFEGISAGLEKHNIAFDAGRSCSFSTPRPCAADIGLGSPMPRP